ncbi:MAG TPA: hypothetical protein VN742_04850 [Candidatus Binataceae bacterium]|nr:hypothetical protein [Candidatus Binataceae bacterium]
MRCIYCYEKAGLLKKVCITCGRVVTIVEESAGRVGWTGLVDEFATQGLTRERVDRVLDAELDGRPALRDRLTSEMANVLMRNLGMPGRQSPEDVQRVRRAAASGMGAGGWAAGEAPPRRESL